MTVKRANLNSGRVIIQSEVERDRARAGVAVATGREILSRLGSSGHLSKQELAKEIATEAKVPLRFGLIALRRLEMEGAVSIDVKSGLARPLPCTRELCA